MVSFTRGGGGLARTASQKICCLLSPGRLHEKLHRNSHLLKLPVCGEDPDLILKMENLLFILLQRNQSFNPEVTFAWRSREAVS
ncbi:hypothetical protein GDO81_023502 [Engystomops pustulosus]|uniref:Uncharacterized protein n=1 Tax=Engystomops pustulosus TaxID=76066 RepID=A0AAV6Z663_ENGPU|nr:hypothetical protein GDO81_023502 [Engystomops pustulosus]